MTPMTIDQAIQATRQHLRAGQFRQAETAVQQVLSVQANHVEALHLLGLIAARLGRNEEAIDSFRRVIALSPQHFDAHTNLAVALFQVGQSEQAEACFQQAVELRPDRADAHFNLGKALEGGRQPDRAIGCYQQALALNPKYVEAHLNLGNIWRNAGDFDAAIASFQRALAIKPDYADAHYNLAKAQKDMGRPDDAVASYQRALTHNPRFVDALYNLGNTCLSTGQGDLADASYRKALAHNPGFAVAHHNLLYSMYYNPAYDAPSILAESRQWNRQHGEAIKRNNIPHSNNRDPTRRLRVGYVSSDFRDHVSAYFLLPLFRHHDCRQFDLFCYAQVYHPDVITKQMQEYIPHWCNIVGRTDAEVATLVRADEIDILVDLKLHTLENRLLVFAHRPAPVQVTWLGYPGTTGMDTIDYRLTDPYLDPPGIDDACYSEQSIRLPDTFWCYDFPGSEPHTNSLPCANNGLATFGCLNTFRKVNDAVLELWAKVLSAVPASRLILLAPEGSLRQRVLDRFAKGAVGPDRIEFVNKQPRADYLRTYNRIDIALDTFPYNGHTTSLDSFWMGVPVITLVGKTAVGRAGLSQLSNLRLPELVAWSPEQYVQVAADLAADRPRQTELRATLRQRMKDSPLMDAGRFARNIEAAYRTMWRTWCEKSG